MILHLDNNLVIKSIADLVWYYSLQLLNESQIFHHEFHPELNWVLNYFSVYTSQTLIHFQLRVTNIALGMH